MHANRRSHTPLSFLSTIHSMLSNFAHSFSSSLHSQSYWLCAWPGLHGFFIAGLGLVTLPFFSIPCRSNFCANAFTIIFRRQRRFVRADLTWTYPALSTLFFCSVPYCFTFSKADFLIGDRITAALIFLYIQPVWAVNHAFLLVPTYIETCSVSNPFHAVLFCAFIFVVFALTVEWVLFLARKASHFFAFVGLLTFLFLRIEL